MKNGHIKVESVVDNIKLEFFTFCFEKQLRCHGDHSKYNSLHCAL